MALSTFLISFWSKLLGTFLSKSSPVLLSHIVNDFFLCSSPLCPHATLKANEIIRLNQIEFYSAGIYFQELFSSQPKRKRIFSLLACFANRSEVKAECAVKHLISFFFAQNCLINKVHVASFTVDLSFKRPFTSVLEEELARYRTCLRNFKVIIFCLNMKIFSSCRT